jgi:hypothetical protein
MSKGFCPTLHNRLKLNKKTIDFGIITWEFFIGGYKLAQKWLKDRKGRVLSYEDIQQYKKIIVILAETDRLMNEIVKIEITE